MLLLFIGAVVAGALTTLAPCVLPMLPVIVGGSLGPSTAEARRRAYLVTASLGVSIVVFTLLLKATTALIGVSPQVWQWVSGGLLIVLGVVSAFPAIWEWISARLALQQRTTAGLASARTRSGATGAILTGAALGPVFSSCSPMYAYVVVTVLPGSFAEGMLLLAGYVIGLCVTLLLVVLLGQKLIGNARWAADPHSPFRRILGLVFIGVGIVIITGLDKEIQAWVIENSPLRPWELDSGFIPAPDG